MQNPFIFGEYQVPITMFDCQLDYRPGDPIYTWVKREAGPMPEPGPWRARPGRGAY